MAHAMHFTQAGVLECTFEQETYEDLLENKPCFAVKKRARKTGFEVLTEAGYPPEMAYFECLHELKLLLISCMKEVLNTCMMLFPTPQNLVDELLDQNY